MKKILLPIFTLLIATLFIALLPTEAEAGIYNDTIRVHILANSDSDTDQKIKLSVRDRLLSEYGDIFSGAADIRGAESALREKLPEIEASVSEWVCQYGYTATAELYTEWFDTRHYEGFSLPAGYYLSLIIKLGEAEGKNWWCVMYPPMCLDAAVGYDAYSDAEGGLIVGKYKVKFKLLELISKSISKNRNFC